MLLRRKGSARETRLSAFHSGSGLCHPRHFGMRSSCAAYTHGGFSSWAKDEDLNGSGSSGAQPCAGFAVGIVVTLPFRLSPRPMRRSWNCVE